MDEKKTKSRRQTIVEWIILAAIVVAAFVVIPNFVIYRCVVHQSSMLHTLSEGESVLVERMSRYFTDPKRFDIITLQTETEGDYVKRVIGLPGETIQITDGKVFVDGNILEDPYGEGFTESGTAKVPIKLGDHEFFVLGDNREVSIDSRFESLGAVKKSQIQGRIIWRVWPINKFGAVD